MGYRMQFASSFVDRQSLKVRNLRDTLVTTRLTFTLQGKYLQLQFQGHCLLSSRVNSQAKWYVRECIDIAVNASPQHHIALHTRQCPTKKPSASLSPESFKYLKISMYNALVVQVLHRRNDFAYKLTCLCLCVRALLYNLVEQLSTSDPIVESLSLICLFFSITMHFTSNQTPNQQQHRKKIPVKKACKHVI